MNYTDYLKKKFDIKEFDYEAVQYILEQYYKIRANDEYKYYYFEAFLSLLRLNYKKYKLSISYFYVQIKDNDNIVYEFDISSNDIIKKEFFYILYVFNSKFSWKISKKEIKGILKYFE
jgi:hypothetical protein